jgi:tripartite-type tricarboxylate transporter receptor subunit TctC
MPKEVSQKLIAAFKKGTEEKSFVEAMERMQFIITYVPGDVMAAQWKRDSEAFGPIIKELGLKE